MSQTLKMNSSETTSFTDEILSEWNSGSPLSEQFNAVDVAEVSVGEQLGNELPRSERSEQRSGGILSERSSGSLLSERSSGSLLIEISNHENRDAFIQPYRSHCNRIDDESRRRLGYIAITFIVAIATVLILYYCLSYIQNAS